MESKQEYSAAPAWLAYTVSGACALALLEWPYGYYQLLRLIVCGYAGYSAFINFERNDKLNAWVLVFVALLYNPLLPVTMEKGVWTLFNLATAATLIGERHWKRSRAVEPAMGERRAPSEQEREQEQERAEFTAYMAGEIGKVFFVLVGMVVVYQIFDGLD